jgi:hypothetical protein
LTPKIGADGLPYFFGLAHETGPKVQKQITMQLQDMCSPEQPVILKAITAMRRILSQSDDNMIQYIIDIIIHLGGVAKLVELLEFPGNPVIQMEAAWCLTNIASGESYQTNVVVASGALPIFVKLLASQSAELRDQCMWALGNIAGDSVDLRSTILGTDIVKEIVHLFAFNPSVGMIRTLTWTMSNLWRGKPRPEEALVLPTLPIICDILVNSPDGQAVLDAAWALSYITAHSDEVLDLVMKHSSNPLRKMMMLFIECIAARDQPVPDDAKAQEKARILSNMLEPTLRCLGNMTASTIEAATQILFTSDPCPLPALERLFHQSEGKVRKEVCWMLSNIMASDDDHRGYMIQHHASLILGVIDSMQTCPVMILLEATWMLTSFIVLADSTQLEWLLTQHDQQSYALVVQVLIRALKELLTPRVVVEILHALKALLQFGEKCGENNLIALAIEEVDGSEVIEQLQHHENIKIYKLSESIISTYFQDMSDTLDDICIPPPTHSSTGDFYSFGGDMFSTGQFNL